jgi:hypothetical protein
MTLNFNNKISTAALFLDIEKVIDTTWHPGLLYELSKLKFSTSLIKVISSSVAAKTQSLERSQISTPRCMQTGVPQGSVLSPTPYNLYVNDTSQTIGLNLALFVDVTCLYFLLLLLLFI